MQFEPANLCKQRKKYTTSCGKTLPPVFFNGKGRGEKRNGDTWCNTATCRPQKPERHKAERKSILSVGFSRRGLDSVDAEVEGDAQENQRKDGTLSKGPGQTTRGPTAPLQRPAEARKHRQGVREFGKSGAWWAGCAPIGWFWACARRNPVSPAPVFCPGLVGRFLLDPVSKSSFTEEPEEVCPGPVAHCLSPQSAGPVKVPCISPPAHPRPVNAFLPWYTHCSLSPHSSDPSSVPTRLTRSSRRLSILFHVSLLPT